MILKYLKDQGGQFWGAFSNSLANSIRENRDRPLKEAMMKAQVAHQQAIADKAQMDIQQAQQRVQDVSNLATLLQGTDTPTEGPATEAGVGPAPVHTPPNPAALQSAYAKVAPGEFIKSQLEPKQAVHIPGGSMVPDPNNPGAWMQVGQAPNQVETPYQKEQLRLSQERNTQSAENSRLSRDIQQGHLDVSKRLATVAEQNANTKAAGKSTDLQSMSDKDLLMAHDRALKTEKTLEPGALHSLNPFAGSEQDQRYAEAQSTRQELEGEMKRRSSGAPKGRATSPTGKSKEERLKGLGF